MTDPSTIVVLVVVLGVALEMRGATLWGRRLSTAGATILVAFWFLPVGEWMMRPLEDRFPPRPLPAHVDGIVVLGGAIDVDVSSERHMPSFGKIGAGRLTTFLALARRYPGARLVFSGGSGNAFRDLNPEADVAKTFFAEQGLDPRRVMFERRSRNTHENALYSYDMVRPKRSETWLLVTSAADIPRAVGCFRAVGWRVVAAPGDYHTGHGLHLVPELAPNLLDADWAAHEWIGLVYYRLRGWTFSLFPGPES